MYSLLHIISCFIFCYTLEIISKITWAFFTKTMITFKISKKTIPRSGKIPEISYQIYSTIYSDSHVSNFGPNILFHIFKISLLFSYHTEMSVFGAAYTLKYETFNIHETTLVKIRQASKRTKSTIKLFQGTCFSRHCLHNSFMWGED